MTITVNGWTYDPAECKGGGAWVAKVGPSRWLIVPGDLDGPPTFTPAQAVANAKECS